MRDLASRIARFSPPKRALLARRLRQQAGDAAGAASDNAQLIAYVVPKEIGLTELDPADLRAFLRQKLPDYMIPSAFVPLETLPRTLNGKVHRQALPAPDRTVFELNAPFVAPRTPDEETLAGLWAEVLGFERIGVHDNFFEIGGHSLLAIQLLGRIREAFQVDLPMSILFEAPTVASLAGHLETLRWATQDLQPPDTGEEREEISL